MHTVLLTVITIVCALQKTREDALVPIICHRDTKFGFEIAFFCTESSVGELGKLLQPVEPKVVILTSKTDISEVLGI